RLPSGRRREGQPWRESAPRVPVPESIDPSRGKKAVKVRIRKLDRVSFGTEEVELSAVEQLVERAQTRAIAEALVWARGRILDGRVTLADALGRIVDAVERDGLDVLSPYPVGELAEFRIFELAAFLNRLRSLQTSSGGA
ncbi:MAG: ATPase, partial [Gemmatimonadota bacterium]